MGDVGFAIRLLVFVSFFSSNAHAWWDDSESNGQYPWLTKEPDVYVLEQLSVFLSGLLEGITARIQQRDENAQRYGNKLREMAIIALPGHPTQ